MKRRQQIQRQRQRQSTADDGLITAVMAATDDVVITAAPQDDHAAETNGNVHEHENIFIMSEDTEPLAQTSTTSVQIADGAEASDASAGGVAEAEALPTKMSTPDQSARSSLPRGALALSSLEATVCVARLSRMER